MAMSQRRLLPSTSMLSAFESAARLGSFSRAAEELSLTQGAISRQIRALEEQLAVDLFQRTHQQVVLTEAGKQYAKEIATALNIVRTATLNVITKPEGGRLRLAILPTFGAKWLIPRLPEFIEKHPDITISFKSHVAPFDFRDEQVDAAIHYGQPDWPHADCTFLMEESVVPVFSPSLAAKFRLERVEDFTEVPLLHLSTRRDHFTKWFQLNGLAHDASQGLVFEQFSNVAQAACAGLGVALMPRLFVDTELKSGALQCFEAKECKSSSAYYLAIPDNHASFAPVKIFRQWVVETAKGHYLS